jgi:tetratricopeptide (TPR) repeat protein
LRPTLYCLVLSPLLALAQPALAADAELAHEAQDAPAAADALSVPPAAEPTALRPANVIEAEQLAAQAFEAYERKEYDRAIELYEKALAAASSADILYNIARVATIALAAGGALLAGGAAIWWLGPRREQSPRVALQVVPTGAAAQIGCSFTNSF